MQSWQKPLVADFRSVVGEDQPVPLHMWDTASREVTPLTPSDEATVYVCGITPYDSTHLGHAATYLTFDVLNRQLLANGHRVNFVQNVTDVDDPLFERAQRDGVDWQELGEEQTDLFRQDMANLGVIPPTSYIGAVEAIPDVIDMVSTLLDNGSAYVVDDPTYPDVYADRTATPQFGYESRYDEATMEQFFAERGGDPDRPGKRDPLDSLLWRAERPGEPAWDSPFGRGRPGWHIECAAIAARYLGSHFDVQGGGEDLIFPHHEYSAAHVEAACGVERMADHYMHTGLIALGGVKMSKSLGNLVFVSRLCNAGTDPSSIRLALYTGHYRDQRNWSDALLAAASRRLALWRTAIETVHTHNDADSEARASRLVDDVRQALATDLDTPAAVDLIDEWAGGIVDKEKIWDLPGVDGKNAHESLSVPVPCAAPAADDKLSVAQGKITILDDGKDSEADAKSVELASATAGTQRCGAHSHASGELTVDLLPATHQRGNDPSALYSHLSPAATLVAGYVDALLGLKL